jgi:hypothetical protein
MIRTNSAGVSTGKTMGKEYRDRIATAVWEAILKTSMSQAVGTDGKRLAAIQSGECVSALTQIMAVLMATSEATSSPTKLREACDEVAKRLRANTAEARKGGAAMTLFDQVWQATTQ